MVNKLLCVSLCVCSVIGCTSEGSDDHVIFPMPPVISEDETEIILPENHPRVPPPVTLEPRIVDQAAEIIPKDDVPPHLIISTVLHGDRGVALKTD